MFPLHSSTAAVRRSPHQVRARGSFGPVSAACALAVAMLLASCAQGLPDIRAEAVTLLRIQDESGGFAERLSVFLFLDDPDGPADFGSIEVAHPETGLVWTVTGDNAMVRLRGKDRWTGSNFLAGPGGAPLPGGNYSITVTDLAGNERVQGFTLHRPEFPARAPAVFSVSGPEWTITRDANRIGFDRVFLYLYDKDMTLLQSWRAPDTKELRTGGTVEKLRANAKAAVFVRCFIQNADGTAGVLLAPVKME